MNDLVPLFFFSFFVNSFVQLTALNLNVCTLAASELFHLKFTVVIYRSKMRKVDYVF